MTKLRIERGGAGNVCKEGAVIGQRLERFTPNVTFRQSYYKEVSDEPVEIEDVLKAGHCVEPLRGMQLCAKAGGSVVASTVKTVMDPMFTISLFLVEPTQ